MNLNMEIGKKKEVYPSKKSLNLYYQEDVTTRLSTIALDILFVVVVVLGLAKFLVVDVLTEQNDAVTKLEKVQAQVESQMKEIEDYNELHAEYVRYSYKILVDEQGLNDRLDILNMLENTVYKNSGITNVSITGNVVSLNFGGMDLNQTAQLIQEIQSYEMVASVQVNNQTGNTYDGTYSGNMVITLKQPGGKQ